MNERLKKDLQRILLKRSTNSNSPAEKTLEAHKVMNVHAQDWTLLGKEELNRLLKALAFFVFLPTLIVSVYFMLIAADQYQTEMQIAIRSSQNAAVPTLFSNIFSGASNITQSSQDAKSIAEYIYSMDAVKELDSLVNLREVFSRPGADYFSTIKKDAPAEELLKKYRKQVKVTFNVDMNTAIVYIRAFTPQDAKAIADNLLLLSEKKINSFNRRAEEDALSLSSTEVKKAEERLSTARQKLAEFRLQNQDIDPTEKTSSLLTLLAGIEKEKSDKEIELSRLSSFMQKDAVQVRVLRSRIAALDSQLAKEQARLTSKDGSYLQKIDAYEALLAEQDISKQAYLSALASQENAKLEAQRQKSYVVPIVQPHIAETAEYPERIKESLLFFIELLVVFGIGRLIVAGIKDHIMH